MSLSLSLFAYEVSYLLCPRLETVLTTFADRRWLLLLFLRLSLSLSYLDAQWRFASLSFFLLLLLGHSWGKYIGFSGWRCVVGGVDYDAVEKGGGGGGEG